jgi:FMN phosphatase YigB (HAD superfamily)
MRRVLPAALLDAWTMALPPFEPTPRAVLFDLDDTLCDYSTARELRLRIAFSLDSNGKTLSSHGRDLDQMVAESIRIHPHGVDHFEALFRTYGIDDSAVAQAAAHWYLNNRFHGLALFPDTELVLRAVRVTTDGPNRITSRPVGIITNGPVEVQRAKIDLLRIDELVDFVIISEEFGEAKPSRAIFAEALQRTGVDASEAVFVGDSPEFDVAGASNMGMRSIWINRHGVAWEPPGARPDREVRHIGEVPPLVGSSVGGDR